jgi:hypothetical protein
LQIAAQREKDGLPPVSRFQIGRRNVTRSEVDRYLRRKRVRDPRQWATETHPKDQHQKSNQVARPSEVVHGALSLRSQSRNLPEASLKGTSFNFDADTPSSPLQPQEYSITEKVLMATHAYYDSCFEPWDLIKADVTLFSRKMSNGIAALSGGNIKRAFRLFDSAFAEIELILRRGDQSFLVDILWHVMVLFKSGHGYLATVFLKYLLTMSRTILVKQHPIHVVADSMLRSPPTLVVNIAGSGLRDIGIIIISKSDYWKFFNIRTLFDLFLLGKTSLEAFEIVSGRRPLLRVLTALTRARQSR